LILPHFSEFFFFFPFQIKNWSSNIDHQDEELRIKGEDGGRARLLLLLPLRIVVLEGDDDEEEEELEEVTLFESLLIFFFSSSHGLSSILWCPTLVEFKVTGRTQLQRNPTNEIPTN